MQELGQRSLVDSLMMSQQFITGLRGEIGKQPTATPTANLGQA